MVERLRVGMIGGGLMARAYSLATAAIPMTDIPPRWELVREVLADATPELAEKSARRFGYQRSASSWEAVVSDPDVDVIVIAVPGNLHFDVISAAIAHGKHVIGEKPLGLNVDEAERLFTLADKARVVTQMGFNLRMSPAVRMAQRLIEDGSLGNVLSIRATSLSDPGLEVDADRSWKFHGAQSGTGAIGDLGSHVIDAARHLVGEFRSVIGLSRTFTRLANGDLIDIDDNTLFMANFDNGAYGSIEATRWSPGRKLHFGFEIYGDKGSVVFDWERSNELLYYDSRDPRDRRGFRTLIVGPQMPGGEYTWRTAGFQIGYLETKMLQLIDFGDAIAAGTSPSSTFRDGLMAARVTAAVQQSISSKAWVDIPRDSSTHDTPLVEDEQ